ncbi:hypothetical protein B0T44_20475 [Nocardia donostiensis]|uniref:histidine kinase n=2 Tax=Nocardia donostiensis TaxID=1538463 RepID=A0A1W0B717_9NOCA|nr:hypothetical protein B0T46_23065 [Nocardia donostiensis]OQS16320.1 hypothetical protein B0T36_06060 [Nocardia donostiensis]OQS18303.1 hypothetical protein B0T44_20475 [Nocardia donostiensis]
MVVVVVVALGAARELVLPQQPTRLITASSWFYIAIVLMSAVLLLSREHRPVRTAWGITALSLLNPNYASLVAAYSLGASGRLTPRRCAAAVALTAGWAVGAGVFAMPSVEAATTGPGLIAAAVLLGLYVGARRNLIDSLRDRAARAEREKHYLAERARAEERDRMVTEMHDVVGHRLTMMVLQAGALSVAADEPGVREAAEQLRRSGREALTELRDVVRLLHSDPRISAGLDVVLGELVAKSVQAGMAVVFTQEGTCTSLDGHTGHLVFRLVREGLTNAHRHAPGAPVEITVRYGAAGARVVITNSAPTDRTWGSGSGLGLRELARRIEDIGGTVGAGSAADGGFTVDTWIPTRSTPVGSAYDPGAHCRR